MSLRNINFADQINRFFMYPKLPAFFKLPSHYVFNYLPRFYDQEKERKEGRRRKLAIKKGYFETDSVINDSIVRAKADARKKALLLSSTIRVLLVIFFFLLAYFLARYFGILVTSL